MRLPYIVLASFAALQAARARLPCGPPSPALAASSPPQPRLPSPALQLRHDHSQEESAQQGTMAESKISSSTPLATSGLPSASHALPPSPPNVSSLSVHASSSKHHHHSEPLAVLDEAQILEGHQPNPLSFWSHDFSLAPDDSALKESGQHGSWMVVHAFVAALGALFVLPLALAFRAARSQLYAGVLGLSVALLLSATLAARVYRSSTPELYHHEKHSKVGWIVLIGAIGLGFLDLHPRASIQRLRQLLASIQRSLMPTPWLRYQARGDQADVEEALLPLSPDHTDLERSPSRRPNPFDPASSTSHSASSRLSNSSTSTLSVEFERTPPAGRSRLSTAAPLVLGLAWTLLLLSTLAAFLTGLTVYAGSCRAEYLNGCLAHLIKGSIFLIYGISTFARYLGVGSRYGWAWNARSTSPSTSKTDAPSWTLSPEQGELSLVCAYGYSQVWLERLGSAPGSPIDIHQWQHISIALLFALGGTLGLLVESKSVRLALARGSTSSDRSLDDVEKPPSWEGSFNPFAPLVIGITGLVMASHSQRYVFQIQIHALWGDMLVAFALCRFLTYAFLWIRPPRSILPSRPPTEALAGFFLTCAGVTFMLSNEQVIYGAMRSGWDDQMAFLTLAVSLTCVVLCWTIVVAAASSCASQRVGRPSCSADVGV